MIFRFTTTCWMRPCWSAIPARFGRHFEGLDMPTYFAMARGSKSAPAMEMTKWFDTN
jgi:Cobalamin-independent synthase, N-terminal domain.